MSKENIKSPEDVERNRKITDFYEISEDSLGSGSFSVVKKGRHKKNRKRIRYQMYTKEVYKVALIRTGNQNYEEVKTFTYFTFD